MQGTTRVERIQPQRSGQRESAQPAPTPDELAAWLCEESKLSEELQTHRSRIIRGLRAARRVRRKSATDVAGTIGVSPATVYQVECGSWKPEVVGALVTALAGDDPVIGVAAREG